MKKYLKKPNTHWQGYKNLFQITVLRYLVTWFAVVPIFASIFKELPGKFKVDILHSHFEYTFDLSLPFSWKILWLSSFFFVIAFALYRILCPYFIRKYNSYSDYLEMKHDPRWIVWESKNIFKNKMDIDKFFSRIHTKRYIDEITNSVYEEKKKAHINYATKDSEIFNDYGVIVEERQTVLYFIYNEKAYSLGMPRLSNESTIDSKETEIVEKGLFWEVFGRYSASKSWARFIILILLSLSGILFVIVLLQNVIKGLTYLIS